MAYQASLFCPRDFRVSWRSATTVLEVTVFGADEWTDLGIGSRVVVHWLPNGRLILGWCHAWFLWAQMRWSKRLCPRDSRVSWRQDE